MCSALESERFSKRLTYFYCANVALLALALFLHGFFPVKNAKGSLSSVNDLPLHLGNYWLNADSSYRQKIDKLVVMVIDAIRYDFIYGDDGKRNMPYTFSSIVNKKACLFKLKANAPTVTMPRIKAITSGSVSNFVDVLMNFGSSEMLKDNIIDQATHNNYKIVFYGDDTWLKLFPGRFNREEGTSSFFVSDYIQVDNNVTRNVDIELKENDWDIMVLHYLGLDHIGHLHGPKSKLIKPKLNEMDDIVKKIHNYLLHQERSENKSTLLVVLGDHGMADFGGHGGTSIPEIIVPLISFGLECGGIYEHEIAQVDIASTLSILLGLPIPADNVGQVILQFLTSSSLISTDDILYALYYNSYQVVIQFLENGGTILHEGYRKFWDAQLMHEEWLKKFKNTNSSTSVNNSVNNANEIIKTYKDALELMSSHLLQLAADFHLIEMIIGLVILAQLFIIALFGVTFEVPSYEQLRIAVITVFCLTVLFWWMHLFDISCCISSWQSVAVTFIMIFFITLNSILIANTRVSHIITSFNEMKPNNLLGYVLLGGTVLQVMSLAATSLIEREDKTWYHLFTFVLIATMFYSFSKEYNSVPSVSLVRPSNFVSKHYITLCSWALLLVIHRILKNYQECQYYFTVYWLSKHHAKLYFTFISIAGLIFLWSSVNNISRPLNRKNNCFFSLCEKYLTAGCLLTVYYYHAVTGYLLLPFTVNINSRGVLEVKIFFILFVLLFLVKVYLIKAHSVLYNDNGKSTFFPQYLVSSMVQVVLICWMLLCTLLTKPYNIWLLPATVLTCNFFNDQLNKNTVNIAIINYWIGMLFYFYQGNGNYISSIDITAGYVGQSDYNAVVAGLFIAINAFSFPVISYLLLLNEVLKRDWKSNLTLVYKVRSVILLAHLFFYLLLTTLHRYHLFIWSVFSPKLLYLSVNSLFIVVLYWFTEAILLIKKVLISTSSTHVAVI